jgi:hypothetical protein
VRNHTHRTATNLDILVSLDPLVPLCYVLLVHCWPLLRQPQLSCLHRLCLQYAPSLAAVLQHAVCTSMLSAGAEASHSALGCSSSRPKSVVSTKTVNSNSPHTAAHTPNSWHLCLRPVAVLTHVRQKHLRAQLAAVRTCISACQQGSDLHQSAPTHNALPVASLGCSEAAI